MQELQKAGEFTHELFGSLTTVKNEAGDIFFIGKQVADILGYVKYHRALELHVDEEDKFKLNNSILGILGIDAGRKGEILISESGLYSLILSSKLESAKAFKRWVTSEVLPDIRKHGLHATTDTIDKILSDPDYGIRLLTTLKEERVLREKAEQRVERLIHTPNTYTATMIGKELGMSGQKLNKLLHSKGIQYKQRNTWLPYSKYEYQGLYEIKQTELSNGTIIYNSTFTGKGRSFVIELLSNPQIV